MDYLSTIVEKNNKLPDVTLDFDALRAEGTAYIAQLGHKLWTDFNVHDPGITMLEVLCFAINDLAYRTGFSMPDLLAEREPQHAEKQFFTAAEILSCCPVTPLDFRKVMIDVEGVKNAWIFRAGAESKQLYREYFVGNIESTEVLKDKMAKVHKIITSWGARPIPISQSYCDFIDNFQLDDCPENELLFDLLTEEMEACTIKTDLTKIREVWDTITSIPLGGLSPAQVRQEVIDALNQGIMVTAIQGFLDTVKAEVGLPDEVFPSSFTRLMDFNKLWLIVKDFVIPAPMPTDLADAQVAIESAAQTVLTDNDITDSAPYSEQISFLVGLHNNTSTNLTPDNIGLLGVFLPKVLTNNPADLATPCLPQINLIIDSLYDGTGNLVAPDLSDISLAMDLLLDKQHHFLTNPPILDQYITIEEDTIFDSLINSMIGFDDLQSLLNLQIIFNLNIDIGLTGTEIGNRLEEYGYDRADFGTVIDFVVTHLASASAEHVTAVQEFLNNILTTDNVLVMSDRDFLSLLTTPYTSGGFSFPGIPDEDKQEIVKQLTKDPTDNPYLIQQDPGGLKNNLTDIWTKVTANPAIVFLPSDTQESARKKILEKDSSIDEKKLAPFLWIFACQLSGNNGSQVLKTNLDKLLVDLDNLQQTGQDLSMEGKVLYGLLEQYELTAYEQEVLDMIHAFRLPGKRVRSISELNAINSALGTLAVTTFLPNLSEESLCNAIKGLFATTDPDELKQLLCDLLICWRIVFCEPEDLPASLDPESVVLNGLYNICLDLEDHIAPSDLIQVDEIKTAVREQLCTYRNLAEDFCDIEVVGVKPVCIEAKISVAANADENQVYADTLYRIQELLATAPEFRSLQELLAMGLSCDEIFNGPLLEHGFLLDEEVDGAGLRRVIYSSDIYQEIMDVEGVIGVTCLKITLCREEDQVCAYDNEWCLDICQKEQAKADGELIQQAISEGEDPNAVNKYDAAITCKFKPLLDEKSSRICIQKSGVIVPVDLQEVEEKLELIRLLNRRPPISEEKDVAVPVGLYRNLHQYQSIQEDFPKVYRVAEGQIAPSLPSAEKAMAKQLKAYLTFFDQLLANYLAQLAALKDSLSVSQSADGPVLPFGSIMGLDPGIDALFFEMYQRSEEGLKLLKGHVADDLFDSLSGMSDFPPQHKQAFLNQISRAVGRELEITERKVLLYRFHLPDYYAQQLAGMVENDWQRHQRRSKILDHLIARFGEQFTGYALSLFQACPDDPCKLSKVRLNERLLRCKTEFLQSIPLIGSHRGKGMNYKAEDCLKEEKFWKTDNVAGMKKRVSRLLCLNQGDRVQLSCPSKVDVIKDVQKDRRSFRWMVLSNEYEANDPQSTVFLRGIKEYTLRSKGKREWEKIRQALPEADTMVEDGTDRRRLTITHADQYSLELLSEKGAVLAKSQSFDRVEEAEKLRELLLAHIFPDDCTTEGFHVVEHLLLRPMSKDVPSLNPMDLCGCKINDPYSFWISVVALDSWNRCSIESGARALFEQTVRMETPAHIGICFLWLDGKNMHRFEHAYKNWLYDQARREADDCQIEESLTTLVEVMNDLLGQKACPPRCVEEEPDCCE
ncbi:MAG: hypothetical protein AAF587_33060 [Bacteroidota bacterium]